MMAVVLVDSNVLLDIFTEDAQWGSWSEKALNTCVSDGQLVINPIIYAEISARFSQREELDALIAEPEFERQALPWAAAFLAGKCYVKYRKRGGQRRSPLPDFYIGAHAAVTGMTLLTRDAQRYQDYFPTLALIAPTL